MLPKFAYVLEMPQHAVVIIHPISLESECNFQAELDAAKAQAASDLAALIAQRAADTSELQELASAKQAAQRSARQHQESALRLAKQLRDTRSQLRTLDGLLRKSSLASLREEEAARSVQALLEEERRGAAKVAARLDDAAAKMADMQPGLEAVAGSQFVSPIPQQHDDTVAQVSSSLVGRFACITCIPASPFPSCLEACI